MDDRSFKCFNYYIFELSLQIMKRLIFNFKPKDFSTIVLSSPGEDPKMLVNFKDILEKIFVLDPDKRITVSQALSHPFITGKWIMMRWFTRLQKLDNCTLWSKFIYTYLIIGLSLCSLCWIENVGHKAWCGWSQQRWFCGQENSYLEVLLVEVVLFLL